MFLELSLFLLIPGLNVHCYKWEKLINVTNINSVNKYLTYNSEVLESLTKEENVSVECVSSISTIIEKLKNFDESALKIVNSCGKFPPTGFLSGTLTDFGDYDQCLSIKPDDDIGNIQYCLVDIGFPLPEPMPKDHNMHHSVVDLIPKNFSKSNVFELLSKEASIFYWISIRVGICTPTKCSKNDIATIAIAESNRLGLVFKNVKCEANSVNAINLNIVQIIAMLILGISFSASIMASVLERYTVVIKKHSIKYIVSAFSITSNIKRLLSTKTNYELSCFSGIRVFTVIWVIIGHTLGWNNFQIFSQTFRIKNELLDLDNQLFLKAYNSVETFFFISGMLTSYVTLKQTKGKYENFNSLIFLVSRYIRLTPQLAIFMLLTTLLPLMGSGPVWNEWISPLVNNCYNNWWQNLIYMQNFIDPRNMCAIHTWYIACDMQYHLISLVIILAMLIKYKIGFVINNFVASGFFILSAILIFINNYPPGYIYTGRSEFYVNVYDPMFYWKPWSHGSVFFVGLGFGYFAYKQKPVTLTNAKKYIIWFCLSLGYIISIYDVQYWISGEPYNRWISALLYPTTRVIWAANTAVLIWMCITGNGGIINAILSWKPFIPLSRVTYSVYLTHAWSVWIYVGSSRQLIEPNSLSMLKIFSFNLLISYLFGTVFSLIFEAPLLKFMSDLFSKNRDKNNNCDEESNDVALRKLNVNICKL